MLKQMQTQKQVQKLLPKIVLSQKLLAIPVLALDNIVKKELEQNPLLEEGSDFEDQPTNDALINEEHGLPTEDMVRDNPTPAEDSGNEISDFETGDGDRNDEYAWDDYFQTKSEEYEIYNPHEPKRFDFGNVTDNSNSLHESLLLQLHLSDLQPYQVFIGEEILWSLDEDGFFADDPEEILKDLNEKKSGTAFEDHEFTMDEFEEVRNFIREEIEPPGIGASDLKDSLLLQLRRGNFPERLAGLAEKAISKHFEDIKNKRFERLEKELRATPEEMRNVFSLLHELNPSPGSTNEARPENYIVPDVIVKATNGGFDVSMNERFTPSLRISKAYAELYKNRKKDLDKDSKLYLINNLNRAKWFIEAINSRRDTMIRIMEAIIRRQEEFFSSAGEVLKPMLEKEIADEIQMDTSTVSRAVKNKYVQTDFGIYEIRSFFTSTMKKEDGEDVSSQEIKHKLKELIMQENKRVPLNDFELSQALKSEGYNVARRTVAKYRESLDIPIAKIRREI